MLIVRTPVRISFGGGGTDLPAYYQKFGGAVLSTAINKHFYTILSVMKELGCAVSFNLFLASEIPPGTGLGSSASVCVNVVKTLTTYLGIPLSKYELAERAFHITRNVLGKPVGKQDEYAASFGGLNFIRFAENGSVSVEPLDLEPDLVRELESQLMLFFTGAAHHSWTILKEQEQSTRAKAGAAIESLHEIREGADLMRATLKAGNLDRFGELLHKGWEAKKRVSRPHVVRVLSGEKLPEPGVEASYCCTVRSLLNQQSVRALLHWERVTWISNLIFRVLRWSWMIPLSMRMKGVE